MFRGSKGDRNTVVLVTANFFGMDSTMDNEMKKESAERPERRAFFGQVLATVGGGVLAGSFLRGLLGLNKRASNREQPVSISANPLAVPRTKEGSKSNV
jgi:hypothetical protein